MGNQLVRESEKTRQILVYCSNRKDEASVSRIKATLDGIYKQGRMYRTSEKLPTMEEVFHVYGVVAHVSELLSELLSELSSIVKDEELDESDEIPPCPLD